MQNSILSTAVVGRSLIQKFARGSGWLRRAGSATALTPLIFVQALLASVATGQRSLRELALEVGLLSGKTISKQGLSGRIDASAVEFLKRVTAEALRRVACSAPELAGQIAGVGRILIGDSSILALHRSLAGHFPGASNQTDKVAAQLRFQLTFDLLGGRWLGASLDPYRRNDLSAATDIVASVVKAGDLVIRDLGYASIKSFRAIAAKGAYFLSRLPPMMGVSDPGAKRIDILTLAQTHAPRPGDTFTKEVELGSDQRFACRLVIIRVPNEVGAQRRRKLNAEAKRRGNKPHRKTYLALQDWIVFVTNLDGQQASEGRLHELYQLRWRIENIFLIWAWLLMMISLSARGIFRLCGPGGRGVIGASIFKSIAKVLQWFALGIELACAGSIEALMQRLAAQQEYHDRYEKRRRISMPDRLARALKHNSTPLLG
jgi:hypothetical protein